MHHLKNNFVSSQVSSEFDINIGPEQFEEFHERTMRRNDRPPGAVGPTTLAGPPGQQKIHLSQERVLVSARYSRNLQPAVCANGVTALSVSSSVFPLMEGCFTYRAGAEVYMSSNLVAQFLVTSSPSTNVSVFCLEDLVSSLVIGTNNMLLKCTFLHSYHVFTLRFIPLAGY